MHEKKISYGGEEISVLISKNRLSKRLKISIRQDGQVKVSIPTWMPFSLAEGFVIEKKEWIGKSLEKMKERVTDPRAVLGEGDYMKHKEKARDFVKERLSQYIPIYGYRVGAVAIRNQQTRWGSCSAKGNLNFNYKLFFLPLELADYVIVHEICHLKEMNHSPRFWELVGKAIPDYREKRRELKRYKI
jgi:predicted metal-dependent hydrolase